MTAKKYLMTTKTGIHILFGYDSNGRLVEFCLRDELEPANHQWFIERLPASLEALEKLKALPSVTVAEMHDDLTFETFWLKFNYKVGDKARVNKIWDALPETERAQAMNAIPKYHFWLANHEGIKQAYPQTWLLQKRYQNEFK